MVMPCRASAVHESAGSAGVPVGGWGGLLWGHQHGQANKKALPREAAQQDKTTNQSAGYGFVKFADRACAESAHKNLNGRQLFDQVRWERAAAVSALGACIGQGAAAHAVWKAGISSTGWEPHTAMRYRARYQAKLLAERVRRWWRSCVARAALHASAAMAGHSLTETPGDGWGFC